MQLIKISVDGHVLNPCPFCGEISLSFTNGDAFTRVFCGTCMVSGPPKYTREEAADAWNTRKNAMVDDSKVVPKEIISVGTL